MIRLTMAALGLLLGASLTATAGEYRLNPGDVLEISVWKEEALQREVLVLPDGTLAFPLAGHVDAAGKTPSQIQGQVAARLEESVELRLRVAVHRVPQLRARRLGRLPAAVGRHDGRAVAQVGLGEHGEQRRLERCGVGGDVIGLRERTRRFSEPTRRVKGGSLLEETTRLGQLRGRTRGGRSLRLRPGPRRRGERDDHRRKEHQSPL